MMNFKIILLTLLLCTAPESQQKVETIIINSNYELVENFRPPVGKKTKKKKLRKKRKHQKTPNKKHPRPGFIIMIIGGLILAGLAIYLGILIARWSNTLSLGCSLFGLPGLIVGALAWTGYIILVFAAFALIISGAILLIHYLKKDQIPKNSNNMKQNGKRNYFR